MPEIVSKHFPESVETQKGHLKKQRQNVRSTRKAIAEPTANEELTRATTKQNIMIKVINAEETIHTDQSGRFPIQSSRGYTSLMVYYDVDANCIDVQPLRNHSDNQMIPAYKALWERTNRGRNNKPKMHILDNEASNAFKATIKENCDLQLVPPDTHRRNLAERAIQTFKSHFIAILAGVDPSFPINLWDRLLPQTVATLNLLRQSHKNPTISAYQHVYGVFDYNKTPFGPLGCAVEMHESANRRRTWDPRSISGYYLGTSMEHYRCHKIFCKATRSERVSDTVFFRHQYITQPSLSPEDHIVKAVGDLASALRKRVNKQGKEEMSILKKMNNILNPSAEATKKKQVTFDETALEPRVIPAESANSEPSNTAPTPRVNQMESANLKPTDAAPTPRVASNEMPTRSKYARAVAEIVKQRVAMPTRSKYARAVSDIVKRRRLPRNCAVKMTELAQAILDDNPTTAVEHANEIFDAETGHVLKYRKLISHPKYREAWMHSSANEFGRLAQGVGNRIKGTDTIFFIHKYQVPQDRWKDVTYAKFVSELKPNKAEIHRTRLTVGGDKVHYPGDVGTPTADLSLVKMHLNSVISTPDARYMTLDVKNFYLNTPMERYEYVRIRIDDIPDKIIVEYSLREKVAEDGHVFIEKECTVYPSPTQKTMDRVRQLMDYAASQEEAILTYHASDMVLTIHSDAGYLNESKSRSRAGGHFYLSNDIQNPPNNGAILTIVQVIDAVMSSAAEAEMGALFINAKEAVHMRRILSKMGHSQPRTPIQMDNSTAEGVINSRFRPKRTKAMDMRFEWLLDRERQGQFKIYWKPGKTNLADFFTKHHPPSHHRNVRGEFLTQVVSGNYRRKLVWQQQTDDFFSKVLCKGVLIYTYRDQRDMAKWKIFIGKYLNPSRFFSDARNV